MITFAGLKSSIILLVAEAITQDNGGLVVGTESTNDMLSDAIRSGLTAILPKVYKPSMFDVEGGVYVVEKPLDIEIYKILSIYDITSGIFLPMVSFTKGASMASTIGNTWLSFPNGSISFSSEVGSDGAIVYCASSFKTPVTEDEVLECPDYAISAVSYYAANYLMTIKGAGSSDIRQFGQKVDSGNPEHLPHVKMAQWYMKLFDDAMNRMPMMQGGSV